MSAVNDWWQDCVDMLSVRALLENDWQLLRKTRLNALRDAPDAFLSTLEQEKAFDENRWRAEFARGVWLVGFERHRPVGMLGAISAREVPATDRFLEYMWVVRDRRRSGLGSELLLAMLDRLQSSGVTRVWLWVLVGNESARSLYERHGFASTHERQLLPDNSFRSEERMGRELP